MDFPFFDVKIPRRKRSLFADSEVGMGAIHIYDYLLLSTRVYEKNKKAINAKKVFAQIRANLIFITYLKS
jgi:hypothetical protein